MKKVLLKDIIIPAGTIFDEAPRQTRRAGKGHIDATIGLSDNTSGTIEYFIDEDHEQMSNWFADVR